MIGSTCDLLDGFLGRWLSDEEQARFAAHLACCSICRQTVQENERLDNLLSHAMVRWAPVPKTLVDRIEAGVYLARRRRRFTIAGLAAAAAILLCLLPAWRLLSRRAGQPTPMAPIAEVDRRPAQPPSPPVVVTVHHADKVMTRPMESKNPNVTIIWVYQVETTQSPVPHARPKPSNRSST
jgi:hypothetical protein